MWVAGIDGCPAGWLVVFRSINDRNPRARMIEKIADVFRQPERPKVVAIDIPIGLPTTSRKGGRSADIAARQVLNARKSSVFPSPSRPTLRATFYDEAKDIERRNSAPPKMVTMQVFKLLDKIREVDAIAASHRGIIFECHPEVSFWAMNHKREMSRSKKRKAGFKERSKLLARNKYEHLFLNTRVGSYKEHSRDDFTDACAAAWTAERILRGEAIRFPTKPEIDGSGLDMAIWA